MPHVLPLVASTDAGAHLTVEQDHGAIMRRSVLPGGVRVLTQHIPGMRSASVGAWVGVGSRDEAPEHAGSTHFLEHLLFKGTPTRSALDIAEAFDRVGGESNAATAKEYTCYYARVIDTDLHMAVSVILSMVTSATIDPSDFELERGVILEELAMSDDDPGDVAHERFSGAVHGTHPLGRPIGGTPEIIKSVTRPAVWEHYQKHYVPQGLVITAAGGVDHDELCAWVLESLGAGGWKLGADAVPLQRRDQSLIVATHIQPHVDIVRDSEQTHIVMGTEGLRYLDDRRHEMSVLSTILGSGMSSRLFQEVRERRGLAYTVYSFAQAHAETGSFGMYAGCSPAKADEVAALLGRELERMAEDVAQSEIDGAIGQICGSTVLRLEDSYSRMSRLGKAELHFGQLWSIGEALDLVREVTAERVMSLAADLASRPRTQVRVGPQAS